MTARRFLGTTLTEGTSNRHLLTYYLSAFACLVTFVGINQLQPYLLTEFLHVPLEEQGRLSGTLGSVSELVIVLSVGVWGIVSDRVGRRLVYTLGFVIMAAGWALATYAPTPGALIAFRGVYAVGAAAATAMLATVAADYVVERDRGKASGFMGVMNGMGAMVAALVVAKLPAWLTRAGYDPVEAGKLAYFGVATFAFVTAAVLRVGLRAPRRSAAEQRPSFLQLAREGGAAARDPRIALSYAAAFVARGDIAIVGTFVVLWATTHGVGTGQSTAEGVEQGGKIMAVLQGAALVWAPIIGIMADKLGRIRSLSLSLGIAAVGYGATFWVTDPTSSTMLWVAPLIGIGQISAVITSQVLIQQQAPDHLRGSVIGFFGLCGALGIMVGLKVGGYLFDHWNESGPFVFVGGLNFAVMLAALYVRARYGEKPETGTE